MDSSAISVLPVGNTLQEVEELTDIFANAFGPDPLVEFTFARSDVPKETREETVAKHQSRLSNSKFTYYKAVDSNGRMLGAAVWYWVEDPHNCAEDIPWGDRAPGPHLKCWNALFVPLRRWRLEYFREHNQPFVYMALLAVRPEARRKGIGRAMLEFGLRETDRRQFPTFVLSSPEGLQLYKKMGWEEKKTNSVNLADYGGNNIQCPAVALIRPAGVKLAE